MGVTLLLEFILTHGIGGIPKTKFPDIVECQKIRGRMKKGSVSQIGLRSSLTRSFPGILNAHARSNDDHFFQNAFFS